MVQLQTKLKVIDNSGANVAKCIKVLGGLNKKTIKTGDLLLISIKSLRKKKKKNSKVKKGEVFKAMLVRANRKVSSKNGLFINYFENSVVILTNKNTPISTRVKGLIEKKLKVYPKLVSIAEGLV